MIPSRRHALTVALVLLTGCGSTPSTRVDGDTVAVVLDDYRFKPQRIRAKPGEQRFALRNEGRQAHKFVIRRFGRNLRKAPTLKPGERVEVSLRIRPGLYELYCALSNHQVLGMYGTLTVRR